MNHPEIRFRDPFLLIGAIYSDIEPAYSDEEKHKLGREFITTVMEQYEAAWRPYETKILTGLSNILGLEFRQNVIDVYAAPFYNSFSFPLVIATKYEPDRAIDVLAHELTHVLLYDNTKRSIDMMLEEKKWKEAFPEIDDPITLIHIPVHATLQALFDDVLHEPDRTIRDKQMCKQDPQYTAAWEYIDDIGYKDILRRISSGSETE